MSAPPVRESLNADQIPRSWVTWFTEVGNMSATVAQSGATANRPTSDNFVGRTYFDTDLGYPVWISTIDSTTKAVTWVNASGATV